MSTNLVLRNVGKRFGSVEVLKNVSASLEAGKIHGIVGRNGSGKTVLFKCICGLIADYTGSIQIDGRERRNIPLGQVNIGIIIENPGFLLEYSGRENLRLLSGIRGEVNSQRIREIMELVGLNPSSHKPVGKYSMGMRQRLGIAQALMEKPELLILDEPFNGLDNSGVSEMREVLKELRKAGKTILIASHNQMDINELCDTCCEMDAGILSVRNPSYPYRLHGYLNADRADGDYTQVKDRWTP